MKNNVNSNYTDFTISKTSKHCYPTEWVIRAFLGKYPKLTFDNSVYNEKKILDLGFGDGRNFELLDNCGFDIYGIEITEKYVQHVQDQIRLKNISADLRVGSNINLPFDDEFFDYILCCSSIYYIDNNGVFDDVINEVSRVLKPGGWLIANFPLEGKTDNLGIEESFIIKDAIRTDDDHIIVKNDIYSLRNGYKLKTIRDENEIIKLFSNKFNNFNFAHLYDNYFGVQINTIITSCQKF